MVVLAALMFIQDARRSHSTPSGRAPAAPRSSSASPSPWSASWPTPWSSPSTPSTAQPRPTGSTRSAHAVSPPAEPSSACCERADALDRAIAILGREAERVAAEGITEAGHQRAAADRLIDAGRAVHQGTGPLSEPAVDPNDQDGVIGYRRTDATPEVDERPSGSPSARQHAAARPTPAR